MNNKILTFLGAALMAGCGAMLGHQLGLSGVNMLLIAGFSVGVVLLGQAPTLLLREKVEALERAARASNAGASH